MPEPPLLKCRDLTFRYPHATRDALVLEALTIESGERVLIEGPTGSGKSTLLLLIMGLLRESGGAVAGDITLFGRPLDEARPSWVGEHLGVVFQSPGDQLVTSEVREEVALGLRVLGLTEAEVRARTDEALEQVGLLARATDPPAILSGGQQQRLALACALARRPRVLLLDEPFSQLDGSASEALLQLLGQLVAQHGLGLVIAEHRMPYAPGLLTRRMRIEEGRVVADGPAFAKPPAPRDPVTLAQSGSVRSDRPVASIPPQLIRHTRNSPAALTLASPLEVPLDTVVALIGPNGAGKSTVLHALAGLLPLAEKIRWPGGKPPRIALVPQNPDLRLLGHTIRADLALSGATEEAIVSIAEEFQLPPLDQAPLAMSKGQRLQIAIAAALLEQPDLLLLDEPTTGQDALHRAALSALLLARKVPVIIATHDESLVRSVARWVIRIEHGVIVESGPLGEGSL